MAAIPIARISVGKLKRTSIVRPMARSGQPPAYPPITPSSVPSTNASVMLDSATPRAIRLP